MSERGPKIEDTLSWTEGLLDQALALAPTVLLVLGVSLGGVLFAYLMRRVTRWAVRKLGIETLVEKAGLSKVLYALGMKSGVASLSGKAAFYLVLALTVHSVAELMGLTVISQGMSAVMAFMPKLVSALGIMVAGFLGADMLSKLVRNVSDKKGSAGSSSVLSQAVYYSVLVLASTIAAEQLGLATALINSLIQILATGVALALALTFAFGARSVSSNWLARHYVTQLYRLGDQVKVGQFEGRILNFSPNAVVLGHDGDEIVIPCRLFVEQAVHLTRNGDFSEDDSTSDDSNTPETDDKETS